VIIAVRNSIIVESPDGFMLNMPVINCAIIHAICYREPSKS
jgi:hypothetical protein